MQPATTQAADAPSPAACSTRFETPVALAMLADEPVVFAKASVAEQFEDGVSGDSKPAQRLCHTVLDVTGAASFVYDNGGPFGTLYVLEPRRIDRLVAVSRAGIFAAEAIVPPLGPNDRIQAVAINPTGQIEAVVSTNGDATKPTFLLFDRLASGAATPLRSFGSRAIASAVRSIAFDARGELYAYDDSGQIVEFRSNAAGTDPTVVRTISGPRSMLRAAVAGERGARAIAIDLDGRIVASDGRNVVTFAADAMGDAIPVEVLTYTSVDVLYGLATDSHGFLYLLGARNEPGGRTIAGVFIFASVPDRAHGGSAAAPIKIDAVAP